MRTCFCVLSIQFRAPIIIVTIMKGSIGTYVPAIATGVVGTVTGGGASASSAAAMVGGGDDGTGVPSLSLAAYVRESDIRKCDMFVRSDPLVRRAERLKLSLMFHRYSIDRDTINNDRAIELFTQAVKITWGPRNRPVREEYKRLIVNTMMEMQIAKDAWGFIPWYERKVASTEQVDVYFRVPTVARAGTFRIPQRINPYNHFEVLYGIENNIVQSATALYAPGRETQQKPFALVSAAEIATIQANALQRLGGSFDDVRRQARGKSKPGRKPLKFGVYMFPTEAPDIDGTLSSAAATAISITEFVERMKRCKTTADSISCNPMLVTERDSGGSGGGGGGRGDQFTAAQHLLTLGDLSKQRAVDQLTDDQREQAQIDFHNSSRAGAMRLSRVQDACSTITDSMTRRQRMFCERPFYEGNTYDVKASQRVAKQPMPVQPSDVPAWEEARQTLVAVAFNVPRSMILGETSSVKAGAELQRDVALETVEFEARMLAQAMEDILNQVLTEREERDIRVNLAAINAKDDRTARDEEDVAELAEAAAMPRRYRISFAPATRATVADIITVAMRGVLPREVEAALLAHNLGIDPHVVELQAHPDPYAKPKDPLAAAALSVGQAPPKPPEPKGGTKRKSGD